jgi:hypothetical protein
MPHRTCGCVVNSPLNRTCGAPAVNVRCGFLQDHREIDLFFPASGVQLAHPTSEYFHFHHTVFSSNLKEKVVQLLIMNRESER